MRVRACGPSFLLVLRFKNALAANHACNFTLDGLGFNLCPLFSTPGKELLVSFAEETPPTRTTQRYAIRFGAPLKHDGTLRSELQVRRIHHEYTDEPKRLSVQMAPGYALPS